MIIYKNVQGSKEWAVPLKVEYDTVYVHSNIKKLEIDPEGNSVDNLYQYDEIQYTKSEYMQLMAERQITESEFTTQVDIDLQESKLKQKIESDMITQHDMDILDILKRLEALENAKIK